MGTTINAMPWKDGSDQAAPIIGQAALIEAIHAYSPHQRCLITGCPKNKSPEFKTNLRTIIHVFQHYCEYACGECGGSIRSRDDIRRHRSVRKCGDTFFIVDLSLGRGDFEARAAAAGMNPDLIPVVADRVGQMTLPNPPAATPEVREAARRREIDRHRAEQASRASRKGKRVKRKSASVRNRSSRAKKPRATVGLTPVSVSLTRLPIGETGTVAAALPSTSATPDPPQMELASIPIEAVAHPPVTDSLPVNVPLTAPSEPSEAERVSRLPPDAQYHWHMVQYHMRQLEAAIARASIGAEGGSP